MFARALALTIALGLIGCNETTNGAAVTDAAAATPADAGARGAAQTATTIVATVHGENITLADVDLSAAAGLVKVDQQRFDVRSTALDSLISERLYDAEAKSRGVTPEELLASEVEAKFTPATDAEIEAFYNTNKARMRGDLSTMRDQVKGFLENKSKQDRSLAFVNELKAKANIKVTLDPPRIIVAAGDGPRDGNADAPIEIIEFSDFQCPYCTRGAATIDEVKEKYGDSVTVVFRHFPLSFHDRAPQAAAASMCANDQGKFWEYHDVLFANQRALQDADLTSYATELGLDADKFTACVTEGKYTAMVDADTAAGSAAGVTGTPGFFINGRFLGGAQPIEAFSEIIDAELARQQG